MPSLRTFLAALMVAPGVAGLRAAAQGSDAPDGAPPTPAAATATEDDDSPAAVVPLQPKATAADGPDIFLLPDETGKLRRVLGYRYEDFFKAWQADGAVDDAAQPPEFVASSLAVEATASAGADAAQAKITIDVELQSDQWVKAPLELGALIVDSSKIEHGSSRDFLMFDAERGGYVAWFKGKPGDRRTISLEGQVLIARDGEGSRLALGLPTAAESVVTLNTPSAPTVVSPATAVVATERTEGGQSRSRIDGVKGPLTVSWGPPAGERPRAAAIEATVDSVISVEQGRLAYEAFITVRGFGSPVEQVRIKLPPGATASTFETGAGYEIVPVVPEGANDATSVVEVRFDEPLQKPPVIRLTAEQSAAATRGAVLRAGAFEVLGAFRQRGEVAVRVSDQLHAHFEQDGRVTQIEPADLPEILLAEPPLAAFETSGPAWAVEVHTQPRQRKVSVAPTYELHLGSQGALLDMALDYQITGGRLFELRVDLRGWELTEQPIESGGAVDPAEQHVTPEQILIMPLNDSDAQQVRLRLTLRREAGLGVHELPLPEVLEAFALPGDLTVTCDEAWRATAQIEKSVGVSLMAPSTTSPAAAAPPTAALRRDASAVRLQTFLPQARLAIDVSEREQLITVNSVVEARVADQSLNARQRLDYEILYRPASELAATVSADLLANEGLELLLDGKPLASTAIDVQPVSSADADESNRDLRLVVRLPQPLAGRARLEIVSHLPLDEAQRTGAAAVVLPLVLPDQPAATTATVASESGGLRVALANGRGPSPWVATAGAPSISVVDVNALHAEATSPARELGLLLEAAGKAPPIETRIESAWAQTWVAGGMRQDRVVYRLHTRGPRAVLLLPAGFDDVEVLLNGQLAATDRTQASAIAIELPHHEGEGEPMHTIELRRHTPLHLGTWGKQAVAFPRVEGADAWSPFFWQLILPPELSAIRTPQGMSAEYRLGWQGLRWGREPTQSQRDLEQWTGATNAPTPSPRTNQYLYSAFQPPSDVEFVAVRRIWMVVAAALGALAVGLAWLYTRIARSAAFWLLLCIAAAGLLFVYPEIAVLMVQAIGLGVAFTLLSIVTQWLLAGTRPRRGPAPVAASSIASLAATQPWVAEAAGSGGSGVSATSGPTYQASGSAS